MYFKRIQRDQAEQYFITAYNSMTTALSNGQAVMWDFPGDADGISVTRPTARATNAGVAAAGVAAAAVASGAYGLIQVFGYHSAVRMRTLTGGSPAIAAGRPLALNAAGSLYCLESFSTGSDAILVYPCAFALAAQASYTTKAVAAFIKAL